MKTLFTGVRDVSLSLSATVPADSTNAVRRPVAIVGVSASARLGGSERRKMEKWIATRVGVDNIQLVTHVSE